MTTIKPEVSPDSAAGTGPRAENFKEEVRALKIKDPSAGKDGLWQMLGGIVMLAGIVVAVISYFMSHNTNNTLTQNDALTIGIIGICLTIAGGAVFLRYSLASFLRFWLARLIFETRNRD